MTLSTVALSDADGSATLFVGDNHEMGSLGDWVAGRFGETTREVPIAVRRFDSLIADRSLPRPDVIKMDIEGNELRALRGGCASLNREDAPILIYEANVFAAPIASGQPVTAATTFLLDLPLPGYQCFFLWHWGLVTRLQREQVVHGDIVAIPAARADRWPALVAQGIYEFTRR